MNEVQPFVETVSVGYFMLGLVVCFAVCSFCDFLEFGIKRAGEKRSFNNPSLAELMNSYRVLGMKGSTYSLVKGMVIAGMLVAAIYVGKPAISNVFASWFN